VDVQTDEPSASFRFEDDGLQFVTPKALWSVGYDEQENVRDSIRSRHQATKFVPVAEGRPLPASPALPARLAEELAVIQGSFSAVVQHGSRKGLSPEGVESPEPRTEATREEDHINGVRRIAIAAGTMMGPILAGGAHSTQ